MLWPILGDAGTYKSSPQAKKVKLLILFLFCFVLFLLLFFFNSFSNLRYILNNFLQFFCWVICLKMFQTVRWKKYMNKWAHLSSFHLSFLFMALNCSKKVQFLQFCADLSKNSNSVAAIYMNAYAHFPCSRFRGTCHLWIQNVPFTLNMNYFGKTIYITLMYLLALFIVQHSEKSLQQMQRNSETLLLDPKFTTSSKYKYIWKNSY